MWLLLSGGVDSTACAHYFSERGDNVTAIFVDFGQRAARAERRAVEDVTTYLSLPLMTLSFRADRQFDPGEIMGRNAFLIFSALMGLQSADGIVSLGVHAGTTYYDCGIEFLKAIGGVVDSYSAGRLALHCPFIHRTKSFVYSYARQSGLPLDITYSCELGTKPPCGICLSCKDRYAFEIS